MISVYDELTILSSDELEEVILYCENLLDERGIEGYENYEEIK